MDRTKRKAKRVRYTKRKSKFFPRRTPVDYSYFIGAVIIISAILLTIKILIL